LLEIIFLNVNNIREEYYANHNVVIPNDEVERSLREKKREAFYKSNEDTAPERGKKSGVRCTPPRTKFPPY
jgi:hypothetical protein